MRYNIYGVSDIGNYRENNEDFFLINQNVFTNTCFECEVTAPFVCAICDGVGGENAGEIASRLALIELSKLKYNSSTDLYKECSNIHKKLKMYGKSHKDAYNMQTTLCGLAVDEHDKATCINIGDSRMYRYTDEVLNQISNDQSLVEYLFQSGKITEQEKNTHTKKNMIFPVLGNIATEPQPEIKPLKMNITGNDIVLICSDGVSDFLSLEEIEIGLSLNLSLKERVDTLIELALERGSTDNLSIIAICMISEHTEI